MIFENNNTTYGLIAVILVLLILIIYGDKVKEFLKKGKKEEKKQLKPTISIVPNYETCASVVNQKENVEKNLTHLHDQILICNEELNKLNQTHSQQIEQIEINYKLKKHEIESKKKNNEIYFDSKKKELEMLNQIIEYQKSSPKMDEGY